MALQPKIKACLENNCKNLVVTDITDIYNVSTNTGGWNSPNIASSAVSKILVRIKGPTQTAFTDIDVTSQKPSSITGEFKYNDISPSEISFGSTFTDGLYEINYKITDTSSNIFATTLKVVFMCNSEKLLTGILEKIVKDCSCDTEELVDNAATIRSLIDGARLCAATLDETQLTKTVNLINQIYENSKSC